MAPFRVNKEKAKAPELPPRFTPIVDVLNEDVRKGELLNVVGVVMNWQTPIETRGGDSKCSVTLCDLSSRDEDKSGIKLAIFRPNQEMPCAMQNEKLTVGDVILLNSVKVQNWENTLSLITNYATSIHTYSFKQIPKFPASARPAWNQDVKGKSNEPGHEEHQYVSYLCHEINKSGVLPDREEFEQRARASANVKGKFCLLSDVEEAKFCDLIVQVCRKPFDLGDKLTLWVTDYTSNEAFFHRPRPGLGQAGRSGYDAADADWHGPYGKRSMQLTVFEPHAEFVREQVGDDDWVHLRNVQIKADRNNKYLEGYLREDRDSFRAARINVDVLDTELGANMDDRLKDALRRRREDGKMRRARTKDLKATQAAAIKYKDNLKRTAAAAMHEDDNRDLQDGAGTKGNANAHRQQAQPTSANKPNSKREKRRQKERQEPQRKELKRLTASFLNPLISCESPAVEPTTVEKMLTRTIWNTTIDGNSVSITLPFTCAKFLAHVRVVDFLPPRLEDFVRSRKIYADNISDTSSAADKSDTRTQLEAPSSSAFSSDDGDDGKGTIITEWRFKLLLEEAGTSALPINLNLKSSNNNRNIHTNRNSGPKRMWVFVDNAAAECLHGLTAVPSLRDQDHESIFTLKALRERMTVLWGDLERQKRAHLDLQQQQRANKPTTTKTGRLGRAAATGYPKPPLNDSSDPEDGPKDGLKAAYRHGDAGAGNPAWRLKVKNNRPFRCCIQQFGREVPERDPDKMDAGNGKRYERTYMLFGTKMRIENSFYGFEGDNDENDEDDAME